MMSDTTTLNFPVVMKEALERHVEHEKVYGVAKYKNWVHLAHVIVAEWLGEHPPPKIRLPKTPENETLKAQKAEVRAEYEAAAAEVD